MPNFRTLDDVDVKGKRVLLRVDLNVPMENGRVTDATRLERVAPTITEISGKGGRVILLAHFGRPKSRDTKDSLKPVAEVLSGVIRHPMIESSVVLPLPDGPIRRTSSPPLSDKLTPLTACTSPAPRPSRLTTSTASIKASVIA